MRVIINGRDKTDIIRGLGDSDLVAAYFEDVKDKAPIGMEDKANWQRRNNELLSAMLTCLNDIVSTDDGTPEDVHYYGKN